MTLTCQPGTYSSASNAYGEQSFFEETDRSNETWNEPTHIDESDSFFFSNPGTYVDDSYSRQYDLEEDIPNNSFSFENKNTSPQVIHNDIDSQSNHAHVNNSEHHPESSPEFHNNATETYHNYDSNFPIANEISDSSNYHTPETTPQWDIDPSQNYHHSDPISINYENDSPTWASTYRSESYDPHQTNYSSQFEVISQWEKEPTFSDNNTSTSNLNLDNQNKFESTLETFERSNSNPQLDISKGRGDVITSKKPTPSYTGALKEENKFDVVGNQSLPFSSIGHEEITPSTDFIIAEEKAVLPVNTKFSSPSTSQTEKASEFDNKPSLATEIKQPLNKPAEQKSFDTKSESLEGVKEAVATKKEEITTSNLTSSNITPAIPETASQVINDELSKIATPTEIPQKQLTPPKLIETTSANDEKLLDTTDYQDKLITASEPAPNQQPTTPNPIRTSPAPIAPIALPAPIVPPVPKAPVAPSVTTETLPPRSSPPIQPPTPTQNPTAANATANDPVKEQGAREISINFSNVSIIEYIRFISRITGKNFLFDESELQFSVTIVSEEPTTVDNLMAALLQELKIRDLSLIEQGNNLIIHRNPKVRAPAHIVAPGIPATPSDNELVTRVFRLNTLDPNKASEIIRPLLSDDALIEVLRDSNNLIITDLVANVNKISQLILSLDAPNSGMTIGQYVVRNAFVDTLAILGERILQPIAQGNPFVIVPHPGTNSIFIVSNPFIVERALAILENLDINEGKTKIFTLDKLKLRGSEGTQGQLGSEGAEGINGLTSGGQVPPGLVGGEGPEFVPGVISSSSRWTQELPAGHIERTLFFIHKLRYRRGDQIVFALRRIADSLQSAGTTNIDLISAIDSIQWIESTNSLIFTGIAAALDRVRELIEEIDLPLRQVFIEVLVLDATIADSLRYGVDWGSRFGGGGTAGAEAFLAGSGSPLNRGLDSVGLNTPLVTPPDPSGLARSGGFSMGIIGRHLTKDGTRFNSIGALVTAIHDDTKSNIVMNPKIITEDNHTAEIFVGSTNRYKTQSIANDQGSVITNNFQFLDVGTTLRVTPLIGSNDVITLDIIQEITNGTGAANTTPANTSNVDVNLVPVLSKNRTLTKAHVPNGFFVIISGMIQDTRTRTVSRVPCLGGIPLIGAANKQIGNQDDKRNLMIFIRPLIVDTDDEIEYLTKRQQDIYREKEKFSRSWNYEIDEALDFFNIKPVDPDEIGCDIK